jgi:preprotein translocase subunit SecD
MIEVLKKVDNTLKFTSGSDAAGPAVDMVLTPAQIKAREDYALEQNRTTLTNRVNELGVSEPIVQRQGLDRINVQLPGRAEFRRGQGSAGQGGDAGIAAGGYAEQRRCRRSRAGTRRWAPSSTSARTARRFCSNAK